LSKNAVCAIDIACLIYCLLGNGKYGVTHCMCVVMLVNQALDYYYWTP